MNKIKFYKWILANKYTYIYIYNENNFILFSKTLCMYVSFLWKYFLCESGFLKYMLIDNIQCVTNII